MYQREKDPIFVNINNIAQGRHLYLFADEKGQYNTELEFALAKMEAVDRKFLRSSINQKDQLLYRYRKN